MDVDQHSEEGAAVSSSVTAMFCAGQWRSCAAALERVQQQGLPRMWQQAAAQCNTICCEILQEGDNLTNEGLVKAIKALQQAQLLLKGLPDDDMTAVTKATIQYNMAWCQTLRRSLTIARENRVYTHKDGSAGVADQMGGEGSSAGSFGERESFTAGSGSGSGLGLGFIVEETDSEDTTSRWSSVTVRATLHHARTLLRLLHCLQPACLQDSATWLPLQKLCIADISSSLLLVPSRHDASGLQTTASLRGLCFYALAYHHLSLGKVVEASRLAEEAAAVAYPPAELLLAYLRLAAHGQDAEKSSLTGFSPARWAALPTACSERDQRPTWLAMMAWRALEQGDAFAALLLLRDMAGLAGSSLLIGLHNSVQCHLASGNRNAAVELLKVLTQLPVWADVGWQRETSFAARLLGIFSAARRPSGLSFNLQLGGSPPYLAMQCLTLARQLFLSSMVTDAIDVYARLLASILTGEAVDANALAPKVFQELAEALQLEGKTEACNRLCQQANSIFPDDLVIRSFQASLYFRSGRFDDCLQAVSEILSAESFGDMTKGEVTQLLCTARSLKAQVLLARPRTTPHARVPVSLIVGLLRACHEQMSESRSHAANYAVFLWQLYRVEDAKEVWQTWRRQRKEAVDQVDVLDTLLLEDTTVII